MLSGAVGGMALWLTGCSLPRPSLGGLRGVPKLRTPLCGLLGIEHPILQAGMGPGYSTLELVCEVSRAGGLGILGATGLSADNLRSSIRAIRAATDRPFGVNLPMPPEVVALPSVPALDGHTLGAALSAANRIRSDVGLPLRSEPPVPPDPFVKENLQVILEEKPPVFTLTMANPGADLVRECHSRGMKVIATVTTSVDALAVEKAGVDAIVAQGWEAGGHRSHFVAHDSLQAGAVGTLALIPEVVDAVKIPVIAAGGIADGPGLVAALALGASGVQLGTRFLATRESGARPGYKNALVTRQGGDTVVETAVTGRWGRLLRNELVDRYAASGAPVLPAPMQSDLLGDICLWAEERDDPRYQALWAGQSVGAIKDLPGAAQVVERLAREAAEVLLKKLPRPR